jgi:2-oxoisovalerate dehydrogenase E1 component
MTVGASERLPVDAQLRIALAGLPAGPTVRAGAAGPTARLVAGSRLTGRGATELLEAQMVSRHLDLAARALRERGLGYYTIGSAGHEANAAVAAALRPTDPALLHYRSGAFYVRRAMQVTGHDPRRDVLLGLVAAIDEPMAGGRHKVFGHPDLAVIPQTSTIASHLPRALGVAFSIDRARRLGVASAWPEDAIAVCSFGDASANHSTATGAINAACRAAHQHLPVPLLLVCEDNGLGISVRTPEGWIRSAYAQRPHLRWFEADGTDPGGVLDAAADAAEWVRTERSPAFLHLRVVRFLAHAGTDVEAVYRTPAEIRLDLERDPILATARVVVAAGLAQPTDLVERYDRIGAEILELAEECSTHPQLTSAESVMSALAPRHPDKVRAEAATPSSAAARAAMFDGPLPEYEGPLTLAQSINRALVDGLARYPEMLVFGEDVAAKGGVYGVTRGLLKKAGAARVFDTVLDEQSILGLALGAGVTGLLPVAEIQYLAYLHNAEDQLRGEAATLQFFSQGQYRNPLVVRIAGYGYQKGFGGHFHNDDAVGVLRDIPGLVIASAARPDDAAAMLRTCLAAATVDGSVCVFLEPIALYHTADLHTPGDGAWLAPYAPPSDWDDSHVALGSARTHCDGTDLTIVTSGNGLHLSLRVVPALAARGVTTRVVDLRWLAPLPVEDIVREAEATGRVLVVDETRRTGGISEGVLAALVDAGFTGSMARVASKDSPVPLGAAARLVLLSEAEIEEAALALVRRSSP